MVRSSVSRSGTAMALLVVRAGFAPKHVAEASYRGLVRRT
jgi:hypothetical protein